MTLERASWIAGIGSALFAVGWGIFTYFLPPASPAPIPQTPVSTIGNSLPVTNQSDSNSVLSMESALSTLNTGISRGSLEARFGPATFDDPDAKLAIRNLIFVFPRFFLQAITSNEGKVIFYSVTTRSKDFHPAIPKLNGKLLESHFADFGNPEHLYSDMTSKYYEYAERFSLGNAGNYRHIYLGYCPSGVYPLMENFVPVVLAEQGATAMAEFRVKNTPNCFGVGNILGDEKNIVENIRMGIDYYVSRDIPES